MSTNPATLPIEALLAEREWVRALAGTLVADENAADDLAQDAVVAAIRNPPKPGALRAWFGTVLRHRASNARRGEARRAGRETASARREATPSTADLVARAETQRRVTQAVLDLAEPYRATVLLRFFEDQ